MVPGSPKAQSYLRTLNTQPKANIIVRPVAKKNAKVKPKKSKGPKPYSQRSVRSLCHGTVAALHQLYEPQVTPQRPHYFANQEHWKKGQRP